MKLFFACQKKYVTSLISLSLFSLLELSASSYPIDSYICTTVKRTVVPDSLPSSTHAIFSYELSKYKKYGYGKWHYGHGLAFEKRLDLMPKTYNGECATKKADLLNFFVITDVHIRDKESPAQVLYLAYKDSTQLASLYSGSMLYTTQMLDATIQTVNGLHKKRPFNFGISLGDTCNATQYNELKWYIDVLDGKVITPSSGAHDGSHTIDYQKPFKAMGLNKSIPWYQVLGNHDHFWYGFLPPNNYIRRSLIGRKILNLGNPVTDPLGVNSRGFYMGAINGGTPYGTIIGAGPVSYFKHTPKISAADPDRRSLARKEWIKEFFNTSSRPKGHGFHKSNKKTGFACYSFEPESNIPIKVIVLDDTQRDDDVNDPTNLGYGHGSLDRERFDWLVKELERGQSEDKLMIIAAHIPIGVEIKGSKSGWINQDLEAELIATLHRYPNLILWIAGHRHINTITALQSPDADRPELGFWEVETASLLEFPQQFRTFRIVRNKDNSVSIFTTNVDPAIKKGSLAEKSRFYAVGIYQIFNKLKSHHSSGSYNAELVKQLTPRMQRKIQK
jgi:metallophosphoesterase (TIGR03768 family)